MAWDEGGGWGNDPEAEDWHFDEFDAKFVAQNMPGRKNPRAEEIDYSTLDLNKLPDHEISKHKKKMDQTYERNFVKPNDPNFVYDKRIQFKQASPDEVEESWEE